MSELISSLKHQIFNIKTEQDFESTALQVFEFQYKNVDIFKKFCDYQRCSPHNIKSYRDIPFLPIEFFKTHRVSIEQKEKLIFESSGTTQNQTSRHYVIDKNIYIESLEKAFNLFFQEGLSYCFLALLPSYLERNNSSLVFMADRLIQNSQDERSGFYLNNYGELKEKLQYLKEKKHPTILLGVSFALLDICENYSLNFPELDIITTGGMKGRRKEMISQELNEIIRRSFPTSRIISEYGMTELFSQAYNMDESGFETPKWMKILISDLYDPKSIVKNGTRGRINVIDLANLFSCSFIATDDLGVKINEHKFDVIGRTDFSDIRGCNLLTV